KSCFFQKHFEPGAEPGLKFTKVKEQKGTLADYFAVKNLQGLIALVQKGTIELHVWPSRLDALEKPDRIIFDLDPAPGLKWQEVIQAAMAIRDELTRLELASFPRTTGGKGLHIVIPL